MLRSIITAAAVAVVVGTTNADHKFHTTNDGVKIPLMGIGVGNMPSNHVAESVRKALDSGISMVDTAAASQNEHLIRQGIDLAKSTKKVEPFLLTKVWYTHLGYARTKLAVEQSLKNFGVEALDCVLIHWPRCDDSISWMNCEEEENNLPDHVKNAGPAPHKFDGNGAPPWRESWRALEELYAEGKLKTIGVSNFNLNEMQELVITAKVKPMIFQGNIWAIFFDPHLTDFLKEHNIMFQAYSVMNALLPATHDSLDDKVSERIKFALKYITSEGHNTLKEIAEKENNNGRPFTAAQIILSWLMSSGVGVIPRTSNAQHIADNAHVNGVYIPGQHQHHSGIGSAMEELLRAYNGMPYQFQEENKDEL